MENLFNISGKKVVITGASSGIGASLAELYAQHKADVALLARREEKIIDLANRLSKTYGVDVFPVSCDVSSENDVINVIETVIKRFGKIDVLVNNAGTTEKSKDITEHTTEQWEKVLTTNLTGTYWISREVIKNMKINNYGKIINISSITGIMGLANQVSYSASKAGMIGLTKSMAVELGKYNITVNAIAPGYLLTELTNVNSSGYRYFKSRTINGDVGTPEDLHGTVLLLSTDASRYMTGSVIVVDGGIIANV